VFDAIRPDDLATRLRNAAILPLAAFLVAQIYFTAAPLLPRVPAALFWSVTFVLLGGVLAGAVAILRALRSAPLLGWAIAWLVAAVVCELATLVLFLKMVLPWL
jgi:hypothetical protein